MKVTEPLICGNFYHIYNCGINGIPIFIESANYQHFLNLYHKYIETFAETFAQCLMGNHFHFLVRIKEKEEVGYYLPLNADRSVDTIRLKASTDLSMFPKLDSVSLKSPNPSRHFSYLFNAYSKHFNLKYSRHGTLFERPFKRIKIDNQIYLKPDYLYSQ